MTRAKANPAKPAKPAKLAPLPDFVEPCLAEAVAAPPSGELWLHEIKLDGYRVQARIADGQAKLLTRRGLDWTARFPGLAKALARLPVTDALLDGEAIVEDERGVASFALLVDALASKRGGKRATGIAYVAFDLMHLDGESLLALPLAERKARLAHLLAQLEPDSPLRYSQHVTGDGGRILAAAAELGVEGIVSKRADLPYRPGRRDWLKAKLTASDEFVVVGYVESKAVRGSIGSLVLGFHDAGKLVYAGRVGTGFTHKVAAELWQRLQPTRVPASPLADKLDAAQAAGVVWVNPELVAQVTYGAWTADGLLRHAKMKALRQDVAAADVARPASHPGSSLAGTRTGHAKLGR